MADPNPADRDPFQHYWTKDPEGLRKWAKAEHPWETLRDHLAQHVNPDMAKRLATKYYKIVFGFYPGSDLARVSHGKPPRGKVIGPG